MVSSPSPGPNALVLDSPIELKGIKMRHEGKFTVHAGDEVAFVLAWYLSHEEPPFVLDTARALDETTKFWGDWCGEFCRFTASGKKLPCGR